MKITARIRWIVGLTALLAALAGPSPGARAGISYQTLDNASDPTFNQLLAINNSGTIAGYFGIGSAAHPNVGYTLAPPYGQTNYTLENYPGQAQTQVTGIDNVGVTVGFAANAAGDTFFGWVNVGGTFTKVTPNTTTTQTQLLGVNDNGQAAGFYVDAANTTHGFVYDINAKTFTTINVTGATGVTATDINNSGVVSGFFTEANGNTLGFLENVNGTGLQTFAANGSKTTNFFGLNNKGQVAGTYVDGNNVTHGMLFNVATQGVTNIDDPNVAVGTTTINGINDYGQLVGFYVDPNTTFVHGLLVNTVPEPGSMILLTIGLATVGLAGSRGRRARQGS